MVRRRHRPARAKSNLQWIGFRDGGAASNLVTANTDFELLPDATGTLLTPDATLLRIVGFLSLGNQAGITSAVNFGFILLKAKVDNAGAILDTIAPLSTDIDDFDHGGILHWRTQHKVQSSGAAPADYDDQTQIIPIDVKVKRRFDKMDTLVLRAAAGAATNIRLSVNLRVLFKLSRTI